MAGEMLALLSVFFFQFFNLCFHGAQLYLEAEVASMGCVEGHWKDPLP